MLWNAILNCNGLPESVRQVRGTQGIMLRPSVTFVLLTLLAAPAVAQREPVLKQIRVSHDYYYREMYLPQVTSGPNAVAWSPDGREVVFSMQGSLWGQRIGSTTAEQLTAGPGYDHQPDWSPDGRFIVFASYRDDAVGLWLLEAATGRMLPLVVDGGVHVDPRWSPDGRRIAYVSTAHEGRWHIYTVEVQDGRAGRVERITEDRDSRLPRYYYSHFDHYLSPTWSPDGREIIFISNAGRIWGTGGFWRMEARPRATPREIHYEETTWRARPDWSPDGRRVVYGSYLGRQWHQLWLMTDRGGDIFPLTYGDFDATNPRWAPDGRRIAYISNEGGNTSLWLVDVPGGRRQRLEIAERRYRGPVGRLTVIVTEGGGSSSSMDARHPASELVERPAVETSRPRQVTGRVVPARVAVTGPDGRGFAPDEAWRHADDMFDRSERKFEYSYFHTPGRSELTVPAGEATVEVTRGLEFRPVRRTVRVPAGGSATAEIVLERLADLRAQGWQSGDLHVHMNYGGAYRNTPERLAFQARAEDLHVVENLIVNKEQRIPDIGYFTGRPDPVSGPDLILFHGQEFHTSFWGHTGLLGLHEHVLLPDYAGYVNTAAASLFPDNATVADLTRAQHGLMGYVHPFDPPAPDPFDRSRRLTHALPVDVALGKADYLEVVGFSDHLVTAEVWYRLLNCGFRLPAGAGTDAMANFASLRGPVGMGRVFVKTGPELTYGAWLDGIRKGQTFVTNGPLVQLTVEGREPGGAVELPAGRHRLRVQARLRSIVPVDRLELVANGRVIATLPLDGDRTAADVEHALEIDTSAWITLRAWNESSRHPVLDIYPFATTSPVYVTVGGEPVRSREDADYFIAWIDRLEEAASAHDGWNTDAERHGVLERIRVARAVFEARR